MLSFAFSPEQEEFRVQLRKFAVAELAPRYIERAARPEFCWDAHRRLAELGVLGIGLPEKHGGTGALDPVTLGLAAETLAYGDVNVASAPVLSGLVASQLAGNGQGAVVDEWLPRLIRGDDIAAIAVTEPFVRLGRLALPRPEQSPAAGGSAVRRLRSLSPRQPRWRWSTPGNLGQRGTGASAASPSRSRPRASPARTRRAWGASRRAGASCPSTMSSCQRTMLWGSRAGASPVPWSTSTSAGPALGLLCLGAAQASIDEACTWAAQRGAFGRPLAAFQGVSFPLAEHATYMEAARWLCYRSLWAREAGEKHTHFAAMSKWWPPIVAKDAIETAMVTFGNLGDRPRCLSSKGTVTSRATLSPTGPQASRSGSSRQR